jgi:hypothetical protein
MRRELRDRNRRDQDVNGGRLMHEVHRACRLDISKDKMAPRKKAKKPSKMKSDDVK